MVISIVACGNSASDWFNTPCDYSIGVNDCWKWGYAVNELLLVNSPKMFEPSRLEVIKKTKCDKVKTNSGNWNQIFPQQEIIRLQSFGKYLKKGHIYSSKSSPFVALSLAFNMGATDVILWGVDMQTHKVFNPNNRHGSTEHRMFEYELRNIKNFTRMMADQGTKVWLGKNEGALTQFLNVWPIIKPEFIPSEEWFNKHAERMKDDIFKQSEEDFKELGYSRTGEDREITFNGLYKAKGDELD